MKIAIWYHCVLSGPRIPNGDHAIAILSEQMHALKRSQLAAAADSFTVAINGNDSDALTLCSLAPEKAGLVINSGGQSEIPTLVHLRARLQPGWAIFYHHLKGVSHPGEAAYDNWRHRMEEVCVWNWKQCVIDLGRGYDAVGCHWLTPEKFPGAVTSPFFGGTFWWARSEYLMQLPPLPPDSFENRYHAEGWIGTRRPYPTVMDYIPGWP